MAKADLPALPRRTIFAAKAAKVEKKANRRAALIKFGGKPVDALMAAAGGISTRGKVKGELVGTRMQPDLLKRLDKSRGDKTRPEKIRDVLDKGLPP